MTYDHLAAGLKEALQNDKSAFDADRLQKYTGTIVILGILSFKIRLCLIFEIYVSRFPLSVRPNWSGVFSVLFGFCLVNFTYFILLFYVIYTFMLLLVIFGINSTSL